MEQVRAASMEVEKSREEREHYRQLADSREQEIDRLKAELIEVAGARQMAGDSLGRETVRHRESEARAAEVIARLETVLEEEGGARQAVL